MASKFKMATKAKLADLAKKTLVHDIENWRHLEFLRFFFLL
jgi:hypothetical protein